MVFSSIEFLYYFLPAVLAVYFLSPKKVRNYVLLASSLVFYAWGGPWYLILIIAQTLVGWLFGLLTENRRGKRGSRLILAGAVLMGLSGLLFFKYTDFFLSNINGITGAAIPLFKLTLPLGISFNTFQILSYNIDLHKGGIKVQRNFFTLFTYIVLFPQLIAGPIVRYATVERELQERKHSFDMLASGIKRLVIGLGKKVLLANSFAKLVEICGTEGSLLNAWLYIFAFAFQLYFDFSGYSDMAIGMGRIFGFKFLENFNYPYISRSVTEFWRRWHISMGSWFRDYIYIPLGGNRVKLPRFILNIMLVWFITGFWHGAGWNFIAWGIFFGCLLLMEKFFIGKLLEKLPRVIGHLYIVLCVAVGWTLFDSASVGEAVPRIGRLFGFGINGFAGTETLYYLQSYTVLLIIALIGCTPIPSLIVSKFANKSKGNAILTFLEPITVAFVLILVTAYLVDSSFNPFIYFRF